MSSFPARNKSKVGPNVNKSHSHRRAPSKLRERFPPMGLGDAIIRHNVDDTQSSDASDSSFNIATTSIETSSMILRPRKETQQLVPGPAPGQPVLSLAGRIWDMPYVWFILKIVIFMAKVSNDFPWTTLLSFWVYVGY